MTDIKLTKKQKLLIDFIDGFIKGNGYSPTFREIMRALGYRSVSTVAKHVDNLVAIGVLKKQDGEVRSLQLRPLTAEKPWWEHLELEIKQRRLTNNEASQREADILEKALEIVKR